MSPASKGLLVPVDGLALPVDGSTLTCVDNTRLSAMSAATRVGTTADLLGGGLQSIARTAASPPSVSDFVRASLSENTRRAYRADIEAFRDWGGTIPASPESVAHYLATFANVLSPFTLARRLVAIGLAHKTAAHSNPCRSEIVRATMRGIRRCRGSAQRRVDPLLREDLLRVMDHIPRSLQGHRDRALLLVGFAGAFRRSELAAVRVSDVRFVAQGLTVLIPRSKTDQEGLGRTVAIPLARGAACPVNALRLWLRAAPIGEGAVFRRLDRHGLVSQKPLSGGMIARLLKQYVARAGFDATRFSGHSLRAGLVTSAAQRGVSGWKIRQQTGHKSDAMVHRYIRDADLFNDNASGQLL